MRHILLALFLVGCGTEPAAPKDDHDARTRRAYEWLRRPGNTIGTILDTPVPESEPMPDGGVRLRFWVSVPGGRYVHREAVFDVGGRIVGGRDVAVRDQRP